MTGLAPVRKTVMMPAFRTGRLECWGAETTNGTWSFEREESPGTPWLMYHKPSVADGTWTLPVMLCGTLRACRALVASGGAGEQLARRIAEKRAEDVTRA